MPTATRISGLSGDLWREIKESEINCIASLKHATNNPAVAKRVLRFFMDVLAMEPLPSRQKKYDHGTDSVTAGFVDSLAAKWTSRPGGEEHGEIAANVAIVLAARWWSDPRGMSRRLGNYSATDEDESELRP